MTNAERDAADLITLATMALTNPGVAYVLRYHGLEMARRIYL